MGIRLFVAALCAGLFGGVSDASSASTILFSDGLWTGFMEKAPAGPALGECTASTSFGDGTMLALAGRNDGNWALQLSNTGWKLAAGRQYQMVAVVDFYRPLLVTVENKSQGLLEVPALDQSGLLGLIENGHAIKLSSSGFKLMYELEGAAKVIERLRNCVAGELAPLP